MSKILKKVSNKSDLVSRLGIRKATGGPGHIGAPT